MPAVRDVGRVGLTCNLLHIPAAFTGVLNVGTAPYVTRGTLISA
jgi:hypothetical protein